jgi:hypothetical protein
VREKFDLISSQGLSMIGRWHSNLIVAVTKATKNLTLFRPSRDDGRTAFATDEQAFTRIEPQRSPLFFWTVALLAAVHQKWAHVLLKKINLLERISGTVGGLFWLRSDHAAWTGKPESRSRNRRCGNNPANVFFAKHEVWRFKDGHRSKSARYKVAA